MILPFRDPVDAGRVAGRVREHLQRGGLLGYPTETVYGLGSAATAAAIGALDALKGRTERRPFILLVGDRHHAERCGLIFTPAATALATAFWPGPLTLVLRDGGGQFAPELRGLSGGIAVRQTSHPATAALVQALGAPLISTSANRSGEPPVASARELAARFPTAEQSGALLVLDGGHLRPSAPSSVVDCVGGEPRLLREGAIGATEIERVVGSAVR